MPANLSTFDAAMKDNYEVGLRSTINNKATVVVPQLSRKGFKFFGRQLVWSVHNRRSGSTGARAEGAPLPVARNQGYVGPTDQLAYLYQTVKVTGQAQHLSQGNSAAFAEALDEEVNRGKDDFMNDLARQICGRSGTIGATRYTGVIGAVTNVAGNVLTFGNLTAGEFRAFHVGMILDIMDHVVAGQVNVNGESGGNLPVGEILSLDPAALTVTLRNATGAVASNFATRAGAWDQEIYGLRQLMDPTAPHGGLDPATTPNWKPINATPGGAEGISEDLLERLTEVVEVDGNGSSPGFYLVSYAQHRSLANQLNAQKRYNGMQAPLKAGWKGLEIAQGILAREKFMPDNKIFALSLDEAGWAVGLDFTWDDAGGSVLYKALDDSDAVQARGKMYVQQIHKNRNAHSFADVTIPV